MIKIFLEKYHNIEFVGMSVTIMIYYDCYRKTTTFNFLSADISNGAVWRSIGASYPSTLVSDMQIPVPKCLLTYSGSPRWAAA